MIPRNSTVSEAMCEHNMPQSSSLTDLNKKNVQPKRSEDIMMREYLLLIRS